MASPHVAGVAGLVFAQRPGAPAVEIKDRLMDTVKLLVSLDGISVTGGMVNAGNAVYKYEDELAADFGGNGLWHYDGLSWTQLNGQDPEDVEELAGGLAADFGATGLWNYDGSSRSLLTTNNAESMEAWDNGLAVDFGCFGLWNYDGSVWSLLTTWDAEDTIDIDFY